MRLSLIANISARRQASPGDLSDTMRRPTPRAVPNAMDGLQAIEGLLSSPERRIGP